MKTILRVQTGSRAYGCHNEDSDHDEVAIVLENLDERMEIGKEPFTSGQKKIGSGDCHIYSLEKFCQLATQGNPNILEVCFSPVLFYTPEGNELIENRNWFWSKQAGSRFLGYMKAQKERLLGERGQKDVNRKDLVEKYGYDTKYAYHIIRLGLIGNEFITSGYIRLPMRDSHVKVLKAIRNGEWKIGEVIQEADEQERLMKLAIEHGAAPEKPASSNCSKWLRDTYVSHWTV
jgi:hypothetical protein